VNSLPQKPAKSTSTRNNWFV